MKKNTPPSLRRTSHAHDKFFKVAMTDKRVAQEFFEAHLPKDFLPLIDLTQLELTSESYVDDLGKESIADMLFKTTMQERDAYLYLLVDHQSRPDKLMPFRVLKYLCNIIDQHLKTTGSQRIPFVLPFVLYHGKQPWKYSTDIRDLVDAPKILIENYFLKPFFLVDLNKIDDEILKKRVWLGVMELTLKHIFDEDMAIAFKEITPLLKAIFLAGGQQFTEAALRYILDRGQLADKTIFIETLKTALPEELEEKMATIAEQFWAEGWEKGIKKGIEKGIEQGMEQGIEIEKIEIAKRLVAENTKLSLIAKVTGLSLARIQDIMRQLSH